MESIDKLILYAENQAYEGFEFIPYLIVEQLMELKKNMTEEYKRKIIDVLWSNSYEHCDGLIREVIEELEKIKL